MREARIGVLRDDCFCVEVDELILTGLFDSHRNFPSQGSKAEIKARRLFDHWNKCCTQWILGSGVGVPV
jgi:hypothetical protein